MTDQATQDAPTDANHRPAVAGQVERTVRPLVVRLRLHADNKTKPAMQSDCQRAADLIETLDAWIEEEGERSNTCTRNILGRVCRQCFCVRAA